MNWLVLLPTVLGFGGVFLLLPRPRPAPILWGAGLGLLALATLVVLFTAGFGETISFTVESFLFYAFALLSVLFAGIMITQNNPARAALAFAVVVTSVCGIFLLQAAPFLMAATIIVYAGAIIVTFLFVVMLARQSGPTDADDRSREPFFASAVGFFLMGTLLVVVQRAYDQSAHPLEPLVQKAHLLARADSPEEIQELLPRDNDQKYFDDWQTELNKFVDGEQPVYGEWGSLAVDLALAQEAIDQGRIDYNPDEFNSARMKIVQGHFQVLADVGDRLYENLSRPERAASRGMILSGHGRAIPVDGGREALPARNVSAMGRVLLSDHLIAIELGGALLLIATVGAIVIAGGRVTRRAEEGTP